MKPDFKPLSDPAMSLTYEADPVAYDRIFAELHWKGLQEADGAGAEAHIGEPLRGAQLVRYRLSTDSLNILNIVKNSPV